MSGEMEIPEKAVEAVAKAAQLSYETACEEPERSWDEIPESAREEWRGDARACIQAALPAALEAAWRERLLNDEAIEAALVPLEAVVDAAYAHKLSDRDVLEDTVAILQAALSTTEQQEGKQNLSSDRDSVQ